MSNSAAARVKRRLTGEEDVVAFQRLNWSGWEMKFPTCSMASHKEMLNITIQSCATKALQVCYKSKPLEDDFCAGFCAEILARVQESIGTSNAVRKTKSQDKVAFWRLLTSSRQVFADSY